MATLVYSPGVQVLIASAKHGIIDVTDDIESGSLTLNENAPHSCTVRLINSRRKYDGVFIPNDRIIVRMKRIRWVQVFAGYLSKVPFASVWSRTVTLQATCSLKKLLYTFYDRGAEATTELLSQGTTPDQDTDGNLSLRAVNALTEIAKWPKEKIHIAALPDQWWQTISTLYETISPSLQPSAAGLAYVQSMATIEGSPVPNVPGDAMVNSDIGDPSIMGPNSVTTNDIVAWWGSRPQPAVAPIQNLANWYLTLGASEGVRGDFAFIQAVWETGYFTNGPSKRDNNFAGIAHYDGQSRGRAFATPQEGILAQIQLLKKIALGSNNVQLANKNVAPNWGGRYVKTVSGLTRNWASDPTYGSKLTKTFASLLGGKPLAGSAPSASIKVLEKQAESGGSKKGGGWFPTAGGSTSKYVHPLPGMTRDSNNFGQQRATHIHQGNDMSAPEGSPLLAVTNGTITLKPNNGAAGNTVHLTAPNGDVFKYFHIMPNGFLVANGQSVVAGQPIAKVGNTGRSYGPHLHFQYHPGGGAAVNPAPILAGAEVGTLTNVDGSSTVGLSSDRLLDSSSYWPTPDTTSSALDGPRLLMNDTPLFSAISDFIKSSMRSFCSAPNGDFIAWFPDYFGRYNQIGKMVIEPIELIDFTIDWDDRSMVTHQFVTGSIGGWNGMTAPSETLMKMITTMGIASVDFPDLLEAIVGETEGDWLDPEAILARFGARPDHQSIPSVISGEAEFFFAVYLFSQAWAQQFSANVPISFMPELWPGMLVKIPSQGLQVYVESVTHTFDMRDGGGFDTQLSIAAPSSLDGRFIGLPKAGPLNPVAINSRPPTNSGVTWGSLVEKIQEGSGGS